ncbi:MAG: ribosome maturation factor RimP [Peptoniphilaceae bacterium]|nr:ribosome maturation factor RimP [Peptoniphilaceae bacterium]MDD7382992.1 ribosome maturation factor RimP [Peptoniphilaceae bacterium]MDY3737743.1 ribosome maturation factor RimP [Peptoniphilaceae bacterium]
MTNIEQKLKNEFDEQIEKLGYELVDVEYGKENGKKLLTFYIYKEDGITIDDCEYVSKYLDPKLDELDLINEFYYLSVSSPDLDRPLKSKRDFERNKKELLEIKIKNKEKFIGRFLKFEEETIIFKKDSDNIDIKVKLEDLVSAKVAIEF